ncbi:hypothetical protein IAI10_23935 [Clostridium sp. 19966]|uniref:hypothetical protein n=1 Tax=Clostridium sp. 19966 TaxID=2768166 RepID=UPI0028E08ED5|nr:hypothetical protein [Clostridium sp. 19966]MDT8719690.1 hypothetical protein [Clostridium sp. 19966]
MKYFTMELLYPSYNNMTDQEYETNDKIWMDNLTTYWKKFGEYENRLPIRFVKEYRKHAFHDYSINSINYYNNGTKRIDSSNVELKISFDNNKFLIRYIGVTAYNICANNLNNISECAFLYSEILQVDDKKMSHEIIFEGKNTAYIEFKKIMFKRL